MPIGGARGCSRFVLAGIGLGDHAAAMARRTPIRPTWTKNLGAMIAEGITVRGSCDTCGQWRDVDLPRLASIKGEDFDLWNRRTRCQLTPDCKGRVRFLHSGRGPMAGMWD